MILAVIFLLLFLVPIAALLWRLVVSRTRAHWIRVGAAAAAMLTAVGAFMVFQDLAYFHFRGWLEDSARLASTAGSFYLLAWSMRRGDRGHRTISVIAAIVGLVPVAGALLTGLLVGELHA